LITPSTIATATAIPDKRSSDWGAGLDGRTAREVSTATHGLRDKLVREEPFDSRGEWNFRELCEATGWDKDDVKEELVSIDKQLREKVYVNLFSKYYEEARKLKEEGEDVQAAEKLWGAITALVKIYSCKKSVFVTHWRRGKLRGRECGGGA